MLDILARLRFDNVSLVVLSACDVGLEMPRPGDEHIGLVRALMVAGAPRIVASLWTVNDLSTMLLMNRFYAELRNFGDGTNVSVAGALRSAQRWLCRAPKDEVIPILTGIKRRLESEGKQTEADEVKDAIIRVSKGRQPYPFANPHYWALFQAVGDVL